VVTRFSRWSQAGKDLGDGGPQRANPGIAVRLAACPLPTDDLLDALAEIPERQQVGITYAAAEADRPGMAVCRFFQIIEGLLSDPGQGALLPERPDLLAFQIRRRGAGTMART
jgi:hypothetical protein